MHGIPKKSKTLTIKKKKKTKAWIQKPIKRSQRTEQGVQISARLHREPDGRKRNPAELNLITGRGKRQRERELSGAHRPRHRVKKGSAWHGLFIGGLGARRAASGRTAMKKERETQKGWEPGPRRSGKGTQVQVKFVFKNERKRSTWLTVMKTAGSLNLPNFFFFFSGKGRLLTRCGYPIKIYKRNIML